MNFPGPWLKGPALKMLLMFGGLRAGDLVKASGGHWGFSQVAIVVESPYTKVAPRILHYGANGVRVIHNENIRAWQRPPLDIELDP